MTYIPAVNPQIHIYHSKPIRVSNSNPKKNEGKKKFHPNEKHISRTKSALKQLYYYVINFPRKWEIHQLLRINRSVFSLLKPPFRVVFPFYYFLDTLYFPIIFLVLLLLFYSTAFTLFEFYFGTKKKKKQNLLPQKMIFLPNIVKVIIKNNLLIKSINF